MIRLANKIKFCNNKRNHFFININAILKKNFADVPHMVTYDTEIAYDDIQDFKIPYLLDEEKQEMYIKYMQDQQVNSFRNLSKEYGTSLERTKAVILLMKQRNDLIARDQLILLKYNNPDYNEPPIISAEPYLDVPDNFKKLYTIYIEDTKISIENLLKTYNESCETEESHINLEEIKVKEILDIIDDHQHREETLEEYEMVMDEKLEEIQESGADISTFRETKSLFTSSRAAHYVTKSNRHILRSFEASYYPQFLRDENVEAAEARLLRRVAKETEAQLQHDVEYYEETYNPKEQITNINNDNKEEDHMDHGNNNIKQKDSRTLQYHHIKLQTPDEVSFSRCKYGFVDTSINRLNAKKFKKENPGSVAIPPKTVIRTRKGSLRYATPLEESNRSWRLQPTGVDRAISSTFSHYSEKFIDPYLDYDQDDMKVNEILAKRRENRKLIMNTEKK